MKLTKLSPGMSLWGLAQGGIMKSTLILMLIHEGPCAGDRLFIPKSFVLKKWGGDDHGANCGLRR